MEISLAVSLGTSRVSHSFCTINKAFSTFQQDFNSSGFPHESVLRTTSAQLPTLPDFNQDRVSNQHAMANHEGSDKCSGELCLELNKLSLSSDKTPSLDTAPSDLTEPAKGSELKRDSSSYIDDGVSTAVDDIGGRSGSIYKVCTTFALLRVHQLTLSFCRITASTSRR